MSSDLGHPAYHGLYRQQPHPHPQPHPQRLNRDMGNVSSSPPSESSVNMSGTPASHSHPQFSLAAPQLPRPESGFFTASSPGSPNTYKVSPCTTENSSPLGPFNSQSPYRSMAPTMSRNGDPSVAGSPTDMVFRSGGGANSLSSTSPPRFKQVVTSPSPTRRSQQWSHPLHTPPQNPAPSPHQLQLRSIATDVETTYAAKSLHGIAASTRSTPTSKRASGAVAPRQDDSAAVGAGNTIVPRRHNENASPTLNSSVDGALPPVSQRHVGPATQSPMSTPPLPSTSVPSGFTSPEQLQMHAGMRQLHSPPAPPPAPPRTSSVENSDRFMSPSSVLSASEMSSGSNVRSTPQPAQQPSPSQLQSRGPAMFGVIGLPYNRVEQTTLSGKQQQQGHTTVNKTPAFAKAQSLVSTQQLHHSKSDGDVSVASSAQHADPSATASALSSAPVVHPRSGSNEYSTLYRKTVARANADSRDTTTMTSGHASCAESATAPHTIASQKPTPPPPASAAPDPKDTDVPTPQDDDEDAASQQSYGDAYHQQQQQQVQQAMVQHITSVAPATVVAARTRAPVSPGAPAAIASAVASTLRKGERRDAPPAQAYSPTSAKTSVGSVRLPMNSSRGHGTSADKHAVASAQLTADTVLPVASREDDGRHSSSTTDTTEDSSSNGRPAPSKASSPSSVKSVTTKASGVVMAGRTTKLSHTTSNPSSQKAGTPRQGVVQPPQQRTVLSATYSGSNATTAAAKASVVSDTATSSGMTAVSSPSVRGRGSASPSVSSVTSASPQMAQYLFVTSRAHLQRYIDQWRDRFGEDKNAYKEGGYLTVTPGKIVHARYVLIQKLGWGEFSTVWLAYDTKHATLGRGLAQAFVAVKVAKCRSSVQEATVYEVSLLRYIEARLPPHAAVTNIIDCFDVQGEFGLHSCMVMPLCGPNLLSVIDRIKGTRGRRSAEDLRLVKEIIISVLLSLHELSNLNVVHTDIKPENVLCCAVDSKLVSSMERFCGYNKDRSHMISLDDFHKSVAQKTSGHLVCLADFGLSALLEPPETTPSWMGACPKVAPALLAPLTRCKKNFSVTTPGVVDNLRGTLIQTREYRAPEVLLGLDFTCATDVWSVGCMAFELITGNFLMDPKKKTREAREMDVEHLAMMMQLIGPLPPEITSLRVCNNDYYDALVQGSPVPRRPSRPPPEYLHRFIDRDGNFIYASRYRGYPRRSLELELEAYLAFREARMAANFILACLSCYNPKNRPSAKRLLNHPWLQGVGTLSKEKASSK